MHIQIGKFSIGNTETLKQRRSIRFYFYLKARNMRCADMNYAIFVKLPFHIGNAPIFPNTT